MRKHELLSRIRNSFSAVKAQTACLVLAAIILCPGALFSQNAQTYTPTARYFTYGGRSYCFYQGRYFIYYGGHYYPTRFSWVGQQTEEQRRSSAPPQYFSYQGLNYMYCNGQYYVYYAGRYYATGYVPRWNYATSKAPQQQANPETRTVQSYTYQPPAPVVRINDSRPENPPVQERKPEQPQQSQTVTPRDIFDGIKDLATIIQGIGSVESFLEALADLL